MAAPLDDRHQPENEPDARKRPPARPRPAALPDRDDAPDPAEPEARPRPAALPDRDDAPDPAEPEARPRPAALPDRDDAPDPAESEARPASEAEASRERATPPDREEALDPAEAEAEAEPSEPEGDALPDPDVPPASEAPAGRRSTSFLRRRQNGIGGPVTGVARVDRRTKRLVKRLRPGDIAVIDHEDIDRVAAETLIDAAPAAVVNASASISGRYPNVGPVLLHQAGIPLLDDVGEDVMELIPEGVPITVDGDRLLMGTEVISTGVRQSRASLDDSLDVARKNMGSELERFAVNTVEYVHQEIDLLTGDLEVPDLDVKIAGRQVLIVVRGIDYREDLSLLQHSGYVRDVRPVTIGVDGGADALLEIGTVPDIIIGDFDSVSERALRCGAQLIVHGYTDGRAPGAKRLDDLDLPYTVFSAPGTSEDVAMLMAFQEGAELMVAVGTHNSMVEFLDKGRAGMASTFLVRMKVGAKLVDAKGVSRLYRTSVRTTDLLWMILAAVFTLAVALMLSEPVRLVLRAFWQSLFSG